MGVRATTVTAVMMLVLVGCGGAETATTFDADTTLAKTTDITEDVAGEAATTSATTAASTTDEDSASDIGDDIDWATFDWSSVDISTVDLSNVDWAAVDFSEIDAQALQARPDFDEIRSRIEAAFPPGSATLTIGDQSWTFDNYYCALGPEQTQNDRVSFSSGAFGEIDGTRVQLDASIQDTEESGRYEGEGTIQSVTLNDVDDFEDPSIGWSAVTGLVGDSGFTIEVGDETVTAEAAFDDELTDEIEAVPGRLEATCGREPGR